MHYQNKPKLNGVYSGNNLSEIQNGARILNRDECKSIRTPWIVLHVDGDNLTFFDRFGVEYIPKETEKFIGNKAITPNIYRIQAGYSVMCAYFYIRFIYFIEKDKKFLDDTNLFFPNEYEKIIKEY